MQMIDSFSCCLYCGDLVAERGGAHKDNYCSDACRTALPEMVVRRYSRALQCDDFVSVRLEEDAAGIRARTTEEPRDVEIELLPHEEKSARRLLRGWAARVRGPRDNTVEITDR